MKKTKPVITMLDFKEMRKFRHLINGTPLENLRFYDGDKRMRVTKKQLDDWRFTGLNNEDFINFVLLGKGWEPYK